MGRCIYGIRVGNDAHTFQTHRSRRNHGNQIAGVTVDDVSGSETNLLNDR